MKKLLAGLLAGALAVSALAGCGSSNSSTTTTAAGNDSETTAAADGEETEASGEKSITTSNGTYTPDDPYKLTFMYLQFNELDAEAEQKVHDTLNEYLRENYCLEVDFLNVSYAEYQQKVQTMLAGGDDLDVFPVLFSYASSWNAMDGFVDLTDYLNTEEGEEVKAAIGESWSCGKVGDLIYGLPACKESANLGGIAMRADICDELGITEKYNLSDPTADDYDGTFYSIDVIHDILTQVHEAYPDMIPTYQSQTGGIVGRIYSGIDTLGSSVGGLDIFATIGGTDEERTSVIDVYDKEACPGLYEAYKTAAEWFDEGLINSDAATATETQYAMVKAGNTFSWIEPIKVGFMAEKAAAVGMPVYVMYFGYEAGGGTATGNFSYFATSIAANSADPDMAWEFIHALYTDPYVMTTWQYGIEGENYQLLDDGTAYYVDGEDGSNYKYHMTNGWSTGNQMNDPVWNDGTLSATYWDSLREYNNWAELSPAFGFVFDGSEYSTEITALSTVVNKYQSQLENGSVGAENLDATLEAFRDELYAAGYQTILDAKQEQLDAWVAQNGVYVMSEENREAIDSHPAITD